MPNPIRRRRLGGGQKYPTLAAHFASASGQFSAITDAAQTGLNPGTGDFTLALWAQPDAIGTLMTLVGKGATNNAGGAAEGYWLFVDATGHPRLSFSDSVNATRVTITATPALTAGQWGHVAIAVTRAGNAVITVNNVASTGVSMASWTASCNPTADFALGTVSADGTHASASSPMNGALDTVAFWKRALPAAEVAALYNNGIGLAYRDLSTVQKTNLSSWWDLDGSGIDAVGVNNLTNNNGVSFVTGKR